jgi:hypothetical protein
MKRLALFVLFAAAACGKNNSTSIDAPAQGDGSVDGPIAGSATPRVLIAAPPANFGPPPGILSELDVAKLDVKQNVIAGVVGGDPVVEQANGKLYIVNRTENNITVVQESDNMLVTQIATGSGSNPQDVAVVGDKLYVPAFGTAGVVVLSESTGQVITTIDLNMATGETDGKPNCVAAFAVGTDVYVACDVDDDTMMNLPPRGNGKVPVIDSTTDTVRTTVSLNVPNPQAEFTQLPDKDLMIPAQDFAHQQMGCVVRITPGPTPVATCQIQNTDVNGTVLKMSLKPAPGPVLYLAVESFDAMNPTYSMSTWNVLDASTTNSVSAAGEQIQDLVACPDGTIVAADATMAAPGVRVYKGGAELTTAALPFGEPPGFGNGMVCFTP